jgi:hypothetical protein
LAGLLWIGTGFSYVQSAMLGIPLDTLALVLLWLWAIAQAYARAASHNRNSWDTGPTIGFATERMAKPA